MIHIKINGKEVLTSEIKPEIDWKYCENNDDKHACNLNYMHAIEHDDHLLLYCDAFPLYNDIDITVDEYPEQKGYIVPDGEYIVYVFTKTYKQENFHPIGKIYCRIYEFDDENKLVVTTGKSCNIYENKYETLAAFCNTYHQWIRSITATTVTYVSYDGKYFRCLYTDEPTFNNMFTSAYLPTIKDEINTIHAYHDYLQTVDFAKPASENVKMYNLNKEEWLFTPSDKEDNTCDCPKCVEIPCPSCSECSNKIWIIALIVSIVVNIILLIFASIWRTCKAVPSLQQNN